jgi:opacity protein-like surface antigen
MITPSCQGAWSQFLCASAANALSCSYSFSLFLPALVRGYQPAWTDTEGGTNWDLAWIATAGTALRVAPNSLIELSYRYSDYGKVKTPKGKMRVARGGPSFQPDVIAGGTEARLRSHGLYIGFRQEF